MRRIEGMKHLKLAYQRVHARVEELPGQVGRESFKGIKLEESDVLYHRRKQTLEHDKKSINKSREYQGFL